jgi:hypothetical protein
VRNPEIRGTWLPVGEVAARLALTILFGGYQLIPLERCPHLPLCYTPVVMTRGYPAGIVTMGGAPLSPVSTKVNRNMRKLKSALDGRSRSSIQYHCSR